jgi:cbb3-type cytochrome oxidase cytochrome c subunit
MDEIVESVNNVTQILGQIAQASQDVQGKTDLDALIAYLQAMGRALK